MEDKTRIDTGEINLSKKYVAPKVIEDKFRGYVLNGKNNTYFNYVNERRAGSPTHSAIISNYIKLIYGLGLVDEYNNLIGQYINKNELKKIVDDFYSQGMAYVEVVKKRGGGVSKLEHFPVNWLAPEIKDNKGNIKNYYFHKDFSKAHHTHPDVIPAYGYGAENENEIYCIRDFQYGQEYFALPKFQSVLQYAELEEEISNFSINHIKKGLAFGYIINIPNSHSLSKEEKDQIKKQTLNALAGSENAGATVFNFQVGDEDNIKVEVIQQNSSHKQWEALREQARDQIITGHEVVSPLLFGINRGSGLSSTSDEMEEAEEQTMRRVIRPLQETITNALEEILIDNGIVTSLRFKSLSENTKTNLSKDKSIDDDDFVDELISKGEQIDENEWELVASDDVDYDNEDDIIQKIRALNGDNLADVRTGTARPRSKSEQDNNKVIIRYRYKGKTSSNSRPFCVKMSNADKLYRKEDIIQMERKAVNPGWGPRGANTYSIWLYKGGGNCHHKWQREIYLRKGSTGIPLRDIISTTKARSRGYDIPKNDTKVSIEPRKMDNNGFLEPR